LVHIDFVEFRLLINGIGVAYRKRTLVLQRSELVLLTFQRPVLASAFLPTLAIFEPDGEVGDRIWGRSNTVQLKMLPLYLTQLEVSSSEIR
jgi:hypothetical protein